MSFKRDTYGQSITKIISTTTALTIGATVTQTSSPFDLGLDKKYQWAKVIYVGTKGGTAGVLDVQMTVTTGATNTAAGAFKTITTKGTALNTGHAPASAVDILLEQNIDLDDVLCNRWIKVAILATGTAADTTTGYILLQLFSPREEPVSTLATNAMDTT